MDCGGPSSVRAHVALGVVQLLLGTGIAVLLGLGVSPPAAGLSVPFFLLAAIQLWRGLLARRGGEKRVLRFGWSAAVWALSAVLSYAVGPICFQLHERLSPEEAQPWVLGVFLFGSAFSVLGASLVLSRSARVAQGTPGVVRLAVGAIASLLLVTSQLAFAVLVAVAARARVSFDLSFALDTPGVSPIGMYLETLDTVAYANGLTPLLYPAYVIGGVAAVVQLGSLLSSWVLAPEPVRRAPQHPAADDTESARAAIHIHAM